MGQDRNILINDELAASMTTTLSGSQLRSGTAIAFVLYDVSFINIIIMVVF